MVKRECGATLCQAMGPDESVFLNGIKTVAGWEKYQTPSQ